MKVYTQNHWQFIPKEDMEGGAIPPFGSVEWAVFMRHRIQDASELLDKDKDVLRQSSKALRKEAGYKHLTKMTGKLFETWEDFCTYGIPYGLGYDTDDIEAVIDERQKPTGRDLPDPKERGAMGGRGKKATDPISSFHGTSKNYLYSRLVKERPDLAMRVDAGELKTKTAAREAGFIVKEVTLAVDPERAARSIQKHFDNNQVRELVRLLED